MGLIEDEASDEQLQAEKKQLLAQSIEMTEKGLASLREAHRCCDGDESDYERYMQLHADYMQAHEQAMRLNEELVQIHKEIQRRGYRPPTFLPS